MVRASQAPVENDDDEPGVIIEQTTDDHTPLLEWEPVTVSGRQLRVHEASGPFGTAQQASLEHDGTHVMASASIRRDSFLLILASLEPSRRDLPPIIDA